MDLTRGGRTESQRGIRPFEMHRFIPVAYWICPYGMSRFGQWPEVMMSPERAPTRRAALREVARAAGAAAG